MGCINISEVRENLCFGFNFWLKVIWINYMKYSNRFTFMLLYYIIGSMKVKHEGGVYFEI